jgi:hypothetical protein
MKDMIILFIHLLTTTAKLLGPGGAKPIIAENLLLKQQLLAVTRSHRRAPNLSTADRFLLGFWLLFLRPGAHSQERIECSDINLAEFPPMPRAPQIPSTVLAKEKNKART